MRNPDRDSGRSRSGRLRLTISVGLVTVITFVVFRFADGLRLVPANPSGAAFLRLIVSLLAGIAMLTVQFGSSAATAKRWTHRLLWIWVGTIVLLFTLHRAFVYPKFGTGERRIGAVVVSWSRADCEGERADCEKLTLEECLKGLSYEEGFIDECWGRWRVRVVQSALVSCSLLVSIGFGGFVGLVVASRRSEIASRQPWPLLKSVEKQADIFVSHSTDDVAFATELVSALLAGGASVFYSPESIDPSESFVERLNHALDGCRVAVLVWSSAAAKSPWVAKETNVLIERHVHGEIRIEIVRLESEEVPALLRDIERIDAFPSPDASEVAKKILSRFRPATPPPPDSGSPRISSG
jgi:hypothetical protein